MSPKKSSETARDEHETSGSLCLPRLRRFLSRIVADLRRKVESVPGHDVAPVLIEILDTHLAQSG
jgi:hypothetical protein